MITGSDLMSVECWFDTDGDGKIEADEIDKIPMFHRAPHRTQTLLREYHLLHGDSCVLYSLTKTDFTSLIKMPEEEQVRLLQKLQERLTTVKKRTIVRKNEKNMNEPKNNDPKKNNGKKSNPNQSRNRNNLNQRKQRNRKQRGGKQLPSGMGEKVSQPIMSSLFRKSKSKNSASFGNSMMGDSNDNITNGNLDSWDLMNAAQRPTDHLNCTVPRSVQVELGNSGVHLTNNKKMNDGQMFSKLRQTKRVYNKIWEDACSREDSRKCGSFADLTLPGSDRAHRLARSKSKQRGWN